RPADDPGRHRRPPGPDHRDGQPQLQPPETGGGALLRAPPSHRAAGSRQAAGIGRPVAIAKRAWLPVRVLALRVLAFVVGLARAFLQRLALLFGQGVGPVVQVLLRGRRLANHVDVLGWGGAASLSNPDPAPVRGTAT